MIHFHRDQLDPGERSEVARDLGIALATEGRAIPGMTVGAVSRMALPLLGASGVPVHAAGCVAWSSNNCAPGGATPTWDPTVDWFGMWYVDTPAYNKTIVQTLSLAGQVHDYGFTSVTRYWFQYTGTSTLSRPSADRTPLSSPTTSRVIR